MKVILQQDLETLGKEGDVVEVAPGYARNFLIPQKMALLATPGNLKALDEKRKILAKKQAKKREEAEKIASKVEGKTLTLSVKAGKEKLFGKVTSKDIIEVLKSQEDISLDKKDIVLEEEIKILGNHPVRIKIAPRTEAKLTLKVVREEESGGKKSS